MPPVASSPASILAMSPAPVAPSGWPCAIAPPHGLSFAVSAPSSRCHASGTQAKASFTSIQSRSAIETRARFRARMVVGSDPTLQLDGVIPATRLALERARLSVKDIDWFEVNEAFACVALAWAREFAPAPEKLNPWGGAIAHGHPLGATGAGLMAKMLAGLEATGGTIGLQTMCIGHGMATATIVERI